MDDGGQRQPIWFGRDLRLLSVTSVVAPFIWSTVPVGGFAVVSKLLNVGYVVRDWCYSADGPPS